MALLHPEKVGIYAEPQGDRNLLNSTPKAILEGIDRIGFKWYYTYANGAEPYDAGHGFDNRGTLTDPGYTPNIVQYPSIWDPYSNYQNTTTLNLAKSLGRLLITYNEPWNSFNGYWPGHPVPVNTALDAWPALMALGNRLASPSISNVTTTSLDWLNQFMAGAQARGYRVDVINVHYYSTTGSASEMKSYLDLIHALYPTRPIIVTEWAMANFGAGTGYTQQQNSDFVLAACQMMDTLSYLEAHCWYHAVEGTGFTWYGTAALNADGTPTLIGQTFAQLLSGSSNTTLVAEFYKNGILVGTATRLPSGTLYPILSLANNTEVATANFGSSPLSFLPNGVTSWDGSQIGTGVGTGGTTSGIALSATDKASSVVLSNGNLTATASGASGMVRGIKSGVADRYFEVKFSSISSSGVGIGVANASQTLTTGYPGDPNGVGWFSSGYTEWPQSGTAYNFGNFSTVDVLGVLLKASGVQFYKNGIPVGTATLLPSGQLYPIILLNDTDSATVNFGATPLSFLPAGSASWDGSQTKSAAQLPGDGQPITIPGQSANVVFMTAAGRSLQVTQPVPLAISRVVFTTNPDSSPTNTPYQYYGDSVSDASMVVQASANVPFSAIAVGMKNVEVYTHGQRIARFTPDASGNVSGTLNFSAEHNGPLTFDVYAWDGPAGGVYQYQCKQRVHLFIEGGSDYVAPTPAAAAGMSLVFSDEFNGPLSISSTDSSAKWYPRKPDGAGFSDFGDAVFQDPAHLNGGSNPFFQRGSFLRIRCKYEPNVTDFEGWGRVWTTGQLASGKPSASGGFYADLPYYAECRFLCPIGGVPWPAFWQTTRNGLIDTTHGNVETDTVEVLGLFPTNFRQGGVFYPAGGGSVGRTAPGSDPGVYPNDGGMFEFHTYGVLVTNTTTQFYMDGVAYGSYPTDQFPGGGTRADQFMIDNAFGGGWGVWNSTLPGTDHYDMWVDFVKVYR